VTDGDGRFISGLTKDDFIVSEDGKPQEIVSFSSERVPVSLAMLLDVSASMTDEQLADGQARRSTLRLRPARQGGRALADGVCRRGRILQRGHGIARGSTGTCASECIAARSERRATA
jgi:hypothetical protein